MRKLNLLALLGVSLLIVTVASGQDESNRPSPPAKLEAKINGLTILVEYSRPYKKGRTVFGDLEPYGEVWRTGANETTWIDFSEDVKINGQTLAKGRYALFSIPNRSEWTIIFNKKWQDWGAYAYDQEQDVLRIQVTAKNDAPEAEQFTIGINEKGVLSMTWDKTEVAFRISRASS